jgi:Protein of unknown function (DUF3467)
MEEQVQLIMSPQHAKALLQILAKNVKKYEDEFGVIQLTAKSESQAKAEYGVK